jgi:hypothetical protein
MAKVAVVVSRTHILIEVTILFARCVVLAREAAKVRVLRVIARPETLWVGSVDVPVAIIVEAIATRVDLTAASSNAAHRLGVSVGCAAVRGGVNIEVRTVISELQIPATTTNRERQKGDAQDATSPHLHSPCELINLLLMCRAGKRSCESVGSSPRGRSIVKPHQRFDGDHFAFLRE